MLLVLLPMLVGAAAMIGPTPEPQGEGGDYDGTDGNDTVDHHDDTDGQVYRMRAGNDPAMTMSRPAAAMTS